MSTYKLVVKGEILPGQDLQQVKARVAKLFKLQEKPDRLEILFSSRPVTVKRGLDVEQARVYYEAIRQAGLRCQVVVEREAASVSPPTAARQAAGAAPAPAARVAKLLPAPAVAVKPSVKAVPEVAVGQSQQSQAAAAPLPEPPREEPGPQGDVQAEPAGSHQEPPAERPDDAGGAVARTLTEPRKLSAGAGLAWLMEGLDYFKMSPWRWVGSTVVLVLILGVLSQIPVLSLAVNVLAPVFAGGFMLATHKLYRGEPFAMRDLFAGFRFNLPGLLLVGALLLVGPLVVVLIGLAIMLLTMGGLDGVLALGRALEGGALLAVSGLLAPVLVMMALFAVMAMAVWLAPALIVLHRVPPLTALLMSLQGSRRNMIPLFVYSVVGFVSMIVASIPFMLGWLVLLPVLMGSAFAGYRQIFTETEDEA